MFNSLIKFIEKFLGTDREYYSDHYDYDYVKKINEVNNERK